MQDWYSIIVTGIEANTKNALRDTGVINEKAKKVFNYGGVSACGCSGHCVLPQYVLLWKGYWLSSMSVHLIQGCSDWSWEGACGRAEASNRESYPCRERKIFACLGKNPLTSLWPYPGFGAQSRWSCGCWNPKERIPSYGMQQVKTAWKESAKFIVCWWDVIERSVKHSTLDALPALAFLAKRARNKMLRVISHLEFHPPQIDIE